LELRHLRYFIRAAELLHFTRAAESLYISQPSLSIHIQQLEEELKIKLFARVGRSVQLTEAGQVLLTRAKRAVDELEEAGKEIEAISGLLRGTLTIATVPLLGSKILPPWLDAFSLLHPNVHVIVRAARSEDVESGLLAGTFDLGFSLAPPEHTELTIREILADQIVLVVSKQHPLAKKSKIVPADLSSVLLALPSHKISSARLIGPYFESIGISPNITIEQDDGHALVELVKLGGFVTFLPKQAMRYDPDVCLLTLPEPGIPITFAAMWTQLNAASTAFLDIVKVESAEQSKAVKTALKADAGSSTDGLR
jgi:LysR family transcriptional regulator, cyn operon transcriptional activator